MNISLIVPAVIFAAVGLFIIAYTAKVLLAALVGNPWIWLEKQKLKKKERFLAEGDSHFKSEQYDQALASWKSALFLDCPRNLSSFIDQVHNLNINVLGRLVSISDKRSTHIINLPVVEELLAERTELAQSLFETRLTLDKLRSRKKEMGAAGKSSPEWALKEFSKKYSELKQKIDLNRDRLESELRILFESLSRLSGSQEITYH